MGNVRARTRHRHVIAQADYDALLEAQGGRCAICGNPPKEGGRRFHVDHDHNTMRVRGLLCFRCNRFLPKWMSPKWLRAALAYLEPPSPQQPGRCPAQLGPGPGGPRCYLPAGHTEAHRAWTPDV